MTQNDEFERALGERLARVDAIGDDDPARENYSAGDLLVIAAFVVITSLLRTALARMSAGSEVAAREAQFGILPVLPEERVWGFGDFTWVNIGLAIATWAFLIGGTLSTFVDLRTGIAAAVIGNVISVALMALATCAPSGKWGLEQYTALRSVLGANGVRIVVLVWLVAIEVGWAAVLSIMFGRSTTHVVNAVAGTDFGPEALSVTLFAAFAIIVCWLVLARGPISIKWVNRVVAPGLFVVQLLMVFLLLGEHDWATLAAITPEGAHPVIAISTSCSPWRSTWPPDSPGGRPRQPRAHDQDPSRAVLAEHDRPVRRRRDRRDRGPHGRPRARRSGPDGVDDPPRRHPPRCPRPALDRTRERHQRRVHRLLHLPRAQTGRDRPLARPVLARAHRRLLLPSRSCSRSGRAPCTTTSSSS